LDGGGMTRPTKLGYHEKNQRLYGGPGIGGAIGYDPGVVVGEPIEPTDPADTAAWFIPYESSADPGLVQWKRSPLSAVNVATTTLDAAPTPGNKLVAFIPLRNADGVTIAMSGTGWNLVEDAYAGPGASDWPCYVYERTVQSGDGTAWTATGSTSSTFAMWILELEGVSAVDASDEVSDSTTSTLSLTPVTADPIIMLSFVSLRRDVDSVFTPATGMTEIVDDYIATLGTNGPQVAINYQVDLAPTGSYTVGSTEGTGNNRAVIAASFVGAAGDVVYLPAFAVNDGDDATFEYVDVSITEFLRGELADPVVLSAIRLRVGLENSGSTTIEVFGANEADFSDEVSLDSTTFTATGSYTAQDVAFSLPATTGYLYLRFELGSAQGIHPHEVELTALSASGGVTDHGDLTGLADNDHPQYALDTDFDAHIADTTDAHDASAVSFDPTGLANTSATDVQEAIEDLDGAISGGGIPATIVDVKGDIIVATAADTVARLPVISGNGSSLVVASGASTGLAWQLNKYDATTAPTVNDDTGDGYTVGSIWIDTTGDAAYICADASSGAAVWLPFDDGGSGGGPLLLVDDMTLHADGDEFTDDTLPGWTKVGSGTVTEITTEPYDATTLDVIFSAQGDRIYKAIDAGDWTYYLTIHGITNSTPSPSTALAGMLALVATDNSGNGTGVSLYNDNTARMWAVASNVYSSTGTTVVAAWTSAAAAATGWAIVYRLAKVGTTITGAVSFNGGGTWQTNTRTDSTTFTRIGITRLFNGGGTSPRLRVGRFNLVP
jgi:hypothetical protein